MVPFITASVKKQALFPGVSFPLSPETLYRTTLPQRDYKNVHKDVQILEESGLIERDAKNHIVAPDEKLTSAMNYP